MYKETESELHIVGAKLGDYDNPLLWVDVLTINASNCDFTCVGDATSFASYINDPATREWIVFSEDAPSGSPPRYLMPGTSTFYDLERVQNDPYYPQFYAVVSRAIAFPNQPLPTHRDTMYAGVCGYIQAIIQDTVCSE